MIISMFKILPVTEMKPVFQYAIFRTILFRNLPYFTIGEISLITYLESFFINSTTHTIDMAYIISSWFEGVGIRLQYTG